MGAELKKQVVRHVRNSLQVRDFARKEEIGCQACEKLSLGERGYCGSDFPRGSLMTILVL
jgi:hypothetical protein